MHRGDRAFTLVQSTDRAFSFALTGDGTVDLSTATGGTVYVHRALPAVPPSVTPPAETIETWPGTIQAGATANTLTLLVQMAGDGTGPLHVPTAGESLRMRALLAMPDATVIEFKQKFLAVIER